MHIVLCYAQAQSGYSIVSVSEYNYTLCLLVWLEWKYGESGTTRGVDALLSRELNSWLLTRSSSWYKKKEVASDTAVKMFLSHHGLHTGLLSTGLKNLLKIKLFEIIVIYL